MKRVSVAAVLLLMPLLLTGTLLASTAAGLSEASHSSSSGHTTLTVTSAFQNGTRIQGMYIELENSERSDLATGFTPVTFTVSAGTQYLVYASSYKQTQFALWSGIGTTNDPLSVDLRTGEQGEVTALYHSAIGTTTTTSTTSKSTTTSSSRSSSTTTTTSSSGGAATLGLIVPLYQYPDSDWNTLADAKLDHPSVPVIAIINPDNGPGSSLDTNYAAYTTNLASSGVKIIGYIDTVEMATSISSAEAQMRQYLSWYPQVTGIFLDDMPDSYSSSFGVYYDTLTAYAHSLGLTTTGNPGVEVSASIIATTDHTMFYESDGLPSLGYLQASDVGYPASHFSFIATSVSSLPSQSYLDSVAEYSSYVYISNQDDSYQNLPTYLMQEMAMLAATS